MFDEEIIRILLNMHNALRYGNMLSFEIYTRKLLKNDNPFQSNKEQYKIFETMKRLYNEEIKDMFKVCRIARDLVKDVYFG